MDLSLFIFIQLSTLILALGNKPATIFKYNSSNHAPKRFSDDWPVRCNNTNGCTFQCDGNSVCERAGFFCPNADAPCKLVCNGKESCKGSNLNCGKSDCNVLINGESAMYNSLINAENASSLTVTVRGQYSLGSSAIACPKGELNANCVVRLGITSMAFPQIFVDHEGNNSVNVAGFLVENESDLRFECEQEVISTATFFIESYDGLDGEAHFFCRAASYLIDGFICADDDRKKNRDLSNPNCTTFVGTWPALPSESPTPKVPVSPAKHDDDDDDDDDDEDDQSTRVKIVITIIVIILILLIIFCAFLRRRERQRNERNYAQKDEYQASDGDDSMMLLVKNSMNKQQSV